MTRHLASKSIFAQCRALAIVTLIVVVAIFACIARIQGTGADGGYVLDSCTRKTLELSTEADGCKELYVAADAIKPPNGNAPTATRPQLADGSPSGEIADSLGGMPLPTDLRDQPSASYSGVSKGRPKPMSLAQRCDAGFGSELLMCSSGIPPQPSSESANGAEAMQPAISGRVLGVHGLGVPDITLIASTAQIADHGLPKHVPRYRAVSNPNGHYAFYGLPEGDYVVRTNGSQVYPVTRISARTGVEYADIVLREQTTFTVKGQVLSPTGEPLPRVAVLPIVVGLPSVNTDTEGRYELPVKLPPETSSLQLRYQLPGFHDTHLAVPTTGIAAGVSLTADAVLEPIEYTTVVTGSVSTIDGAPLEGRTVELRPLATGRMLTAVTDTDGHFRFDFVEAPLEYRVSVSSGPRYSDFRKQIRISAQESELDIVVTPFEFAALSGRITNQEGVPIPDLDLVLRNTASLAPNARITSDNDGRFAVESAPAGQLVIASQSMPAFLVKGLYVDPGDSLDVPLVLDWGEHLLRGLVIDKRGNPVPASRVLLTWSHASNGIQTVATRRAAADARGMFEFSRLGPGPHQLEIEAPGFPTVALEHDVSRDGYDVTVSLN